MTNQPPPPSPPRQLRIGDLAPDFEARSTAGPVKLSDFRKRWLILLSHPADFTPVCTSEFVEIAQQASEFERRQCALMALSIDSLFSHFAWLRSIRDRFGIEVRFPIIEDPTLVIAREYGMTSSQDTDSGTVRTTFFIDPHGLIRAMTYYPASMGRSIPEMLRMLDALQTIDAKNALAPANWQPGDPLLQPLTLDLDEVYKPDDKSSWFTGKLDTSDQKGRVD